MTGLPAASVLGSACWVGHWIDDTEVVDESRSGAGDLPSETLDAPRIARADRLTRLAAGAVFRALRGIPGVPGDRLAVLGGSVLASLRTNESYERRRLRTGLASPRNFPYTAPNAWLGEVGAALDARGPSLCLVGDGAVGLAVLATASRWLAEGDCDRAVVVVAESAPDDPALLPPNWRGFKDGAAALIIEREHDQALHTIRIALETSREDHLVSSLDVMVRLVSCLARGGNHHLEAPARAGAGFSVDVQGVMLRMP